MTWSPQRFDHVVKHRGIADRRGSIRNHSSGFTLLEIVIVLIIIGLITGGSIAAVMLLSSERAIKDQTSEIEMLAKKAHTAAILHQRPYIIEFHPDSIRLMPMSKTGDDQPMRGSSHTTILGETHHSTGSALNETISINSDLTLSIRHWNTNDFITPSQNLHPTWRFDPDGLCEPITIRIEMDDSYAQDTYHPLTASVAESEFEFN